MDLTNELQIIPGVRGEVMLPTFEEQDRFRMSWRAEIKPHLDELERLRAECERDALYDFFNRAY